MSVFNESPRATLLVVAVVILLSGFSLFRTSTKNPYEAEFTVYYQNMAHQLQTATEGLSRGAEVVVLVFALDLKLGDKGMLNKALKSLKRQGITLLELEALDYRDDAGWLESQPGFPYAEYVRIAEGYRGADAIISLCGLPYGFKGASPPKEAGLPPLLIASDESDSMASVERLLEKGWIQAAVVRGEESDQGPVFTRLP